VVTVPTVRCPRRGLREGRPGNVWRALRDDMRGQDLVELVLTLPILLVVAFGILELGSLLDIQHSLSGLTREGANIASRGASLDSVVQVTVQNGNSWKLAAGGSVIASRVDIQGGVPRVTAQRAGGSLGAQSRLGQNGQIAAPLVGQGLANGTSYYVVEVFLPYRAFTPLRNFVSSVVPDTLYDRTLF